MADSISIAERCAFIIQIIDQAKKIPDRYIKETKLSYLDQRRFSDLASAVDSGVKKRSE
jgi:hypothetical protein